MTARPDRPGAACGVLRKTSGTVVDDMIWLHDVHNTPIGMQCAILYGNEDCSERIEAWRTNNPHYQSPPDFVYVRVDITN
jgi:hypothetical protein